MNQFGFVAEWLWANTVYEAGEDGAEKVISRCAEMGITDIFLLVKGNLGRVSYLKGEAPLQRSDYGGRDILQEVVEAAHAHGIRLHAWICNSGDATYKATYPQSGMYHYVNGRKDNNRINFYDEGYRAYMANVISEMVRDYDIDGLHFDYIRYNHLTNGWSETDFANLEAMGAEVSHIKEMIERTFGYNGFAEDSNYIFTQFASGDKDAQLIADYRRGNVVSYAKKIIAAARAVKPDLIISAALMPEGAYDQAFADLHYGQNHTDAAALYDYVTPMAYSSDLKQDAAWVARVAKGSIDKGNKAVVGLQAYGLSKAVNLMEDVEAVRPLLSDETYGKNMLGIALFRTSQFAYAKVSCDILGKTMTIKTINSSIESAYACVRVDLQKGLKACFGAVVEGYKEGTSASVGEGYVKFCGTDILDMGGEGTLTIGYEGEVNLSQVPAVVRVYNTEEEGCAYTVCES